MIQVLESSSGRERLAAAEAFVGAHPPSTELLLIGDSRDAVDDLVRRVSRGVGATFGLHRFSFAQWVAALAAGELARTGRAPASALGQQAVAARAAFEALGRDEAPRYAPISHFPGFARALASTLSELRQAALGDDPIDGRVPETADLAALLRGYTDELTSASIADRAELLRLARAGIAESRLAGLRNAPTLLLDVRVTSALEQELLGEFCRDSPDLLVTVPTGDRRTLAAMEALFGAGAIARGTPEATDSGLSRLRSFLFAEEPPPPGSGGDQVRFFSAPGEGRECTEIARLALAEARRGVPFDAMAVLVRTPEAYQTLLETALRRAEIPAYFARGTRRPDPSGRAFLALLACRAEGLSAKRFAEYLSFAQVPDLDSSGAPPTDREFWAGPDDDSLGAASRAAVEVASAEAAEAEARPRQLALDFDGAPAIEGTLRAPWKWEELLVEAAVIGGLERWRRRIAGLEHELRLRLGELTDEEPGSPRRRGMQRELANLVHLERFALPVVEVLDALPQAERWGAWLAALTQLAPRVLRDPQRVLAVLAELAPMASIGPVGIDEVRTVLVQRLLSLEAERPADRYGRLFVATPDHARGRSFRVVFVPGLAERVFPQRPREDPLLLDALRMRLSDDLETQEDRGRDERLFLRLAAGAAEERIVLSYPRVDVQQARPRVPSFYGLDVARATRGVVPDYEELERDAATEVDARLAWPAPPDPDRAIDAIEHDLAILGPLLHGETDDPGGRARYLLELNPHLGRSLRSRWARWRQRRWTPQDGLVRVTEHTAAALEKHRPGARPYSATALQKFAACPYRFLLSAIHRLEPRKEAVSIERMDPLTRGALFHEVQAATLRRLRAAGALPLKQASPGPARDLLDETLAEIAGAYQDDLAPAIPRVWDDEIDRVRADLRAWLLRLAAETVWQPAFFEYSFGLPLGDGRDPASREEPVRLPGGWLLRGAVDLIERDPRNGDLRVTDHKTGADRTTAGLVVGAGEILQPVLYGLAVEAALDKRVAAGRLFFCTSRGGFAEHEVPIDDRARLYGTEVLQIVDRAVAEGNLPPAPRREACAYCDFRPVCGPLEEIRTARKERGPLADVLELRTLP